MSQEVAQIDPSATAQRLQDLRKAAIDALKGLNLPQTLARTRDDSINAVQSLQVDKLRDYLNSTISDLSRAGNPIALRKFYVAYRSSGETDRKLAISYLVTLGGLETGGRDEDDGLGITKAESDLLRELFKSLLKKLR